ncbi:MAG: hypothetical protein MUF36_04770 [Bacteroidales bacterium]|jgi:hypothetical protein|nr:hypothetical protein [Bacteroidales bacterium]
MKKTFLLLTILMISLSGTAQLSFQDAGNSSTTSVLYKPVEPISTPLAISNDEKQINRGDLIISGSASFYSWFNHFESGASSNNTSGVHFGLSPTFLFFLSDGLALGSRVSAGFSTTEGNFSYNIGLGPEFRYYFDFGLFMKLGASYDFNHSESYSYNTIEIEPAIGYAIFLNPHVALEPGFFYNLSLSNYDYSTSTSKYLNHNIGIQVGISIFL